MKQWKLYFYREISKVFFFFLFGFFFLYSIIEYSTHMDDFFKTPNANAYSIALYYVNQFLKRLDFLSPWHSCFQPSKSSPPSMHGMNGPYSKSPASPRVPSSDLFLWSP